MTEVYFQQSFSSNSEVCSLTVCFLVLRPTNHYTCTAHDRSATIQTLISFIGTLGRYQYPRNLLPANFDMQYDNMKHNTIGMCWAFHKHDYLKVVCIFVRCYNMRILKSYHSVAVHEQVTIHRNCPPKGWIWRGITSHVTIRKLG